MHQKYRGSFLFLCLILFLASLFFYFSKEQRTAFPVHEEGRLISVGDLKDLSAKKESFVLLDVRLQEEYDAGHIENAILMPLNTLSTRFNELPKDKPIIVYCRTGRRSAQATSFLRSKGFANAIDLSGGYSEWMSRKTAEPH
ncbi:MAG: rhodanese-like domain-containing protein [Bdellovibrionales bacterium]